MTQPPGKLSQLLLVTLFGVVISLPLAGTCLAPGARSNAGTITVTGLTSALVLEPLPLDLRQRAACGALQRVVVPVFVQPVGIHDQRVENEGDQSFRLWQALRRKL